MMKCQVCNDMIGREENPSMHGMAVVTNGELGTEIFKACFGFWNHRKKEYFCICGACLAEKLEMLSQIVVNDYKTITASVVPYLAACSFKGTVDADEPQIVAK